MYALRCAGVCIHVRLLGAIAAVRDGETLVEGAPRQPSLLALVLLERGARVAAERLAEAGFAAFRPTLTATGKELIADEHAD